MSPRSVLSIATTLSLLTVVTIVGNPTPVAAATTTVGPFSGPCDFAGTPPGNNDRQVTATLSVPDSVEVGEAFDADITIEFDLPAAVIVVYDFEIVSEWVVTGPGAPAGALTVVTPARDYTVGDPIVFDTVSVPITATAEGTIGLHFAGAVYRFAFSSGGGQAVAACTFAALPVEVDSVAVTAASLQCLGHPVTIVGTAGNDVIVGTNGPDVIHAVGGNNVVMGRGGDDVICGGPGDDVILGGPGNDVIDGGGGFNIIIGGPGDDICTNGLAILC